MRLRALSLAVAAILTASAGGAAAAGAFYTLRFDLFSAPGVQCGSAGALRVGRDIVGRPIIVTRGGPVSCRTADGRSYDVRTPVDPRDPLARGVDVIVVDRPGRAVPMLMVQADGQKEPTVVRNDAAALPDPAGARTTGQDRK